MNSYHKYIKKVFICNIRDSFAIKMYNRKDSGDDSDSIVNEEKLVEG
jgi:hypothetical protein